MTKCRKKSLPGLLLSAFALLAPLASSAALLPPGSGDPQLPVRRPAPLEVFERYPILNLTHSLTLGGAFDSNSLSYLDAAHGVWKFYSVIAHLVIPGAGGLFVDGKVGLSQRTSAADLSSSLAPGAAVALGYLIHAGPAEIIPAIEMRFISNSPYGNEIVPTSAMAEASVQVRFRF